MKDIDDKMLSITNLAANIALIGKINGFKDEIPSKRRIKGVVNKIVKLIPQSLRLFSWQKPFWWWWFSKHVYWSTNA